MINWYNLFRPTRVTDDHPKVADGGIGNFDPFLIQKSCEIKPFETQIKNNVCDSKNI